MHRVLLDNQVIQLEDLGRKEGAHPPA